MQNPLMQTIEALAKEKGIEPEMIITAIEDAVLTASRKYYKTNENLKTRFNQETGQVDLFATKQIVQNVENPATEISLKEAQELYFDREKDHQVEWALRIFRHIYTQTIDEAWVDHLSNMEHLRDGIGLRGYGQRDPKNEYKKEGYNLFLNMMAKV